MTERWREIGLNEAMFRRMNEGTTQIERAAQLVEDDVEIVCECGDSDCAERLTVPLAGYEEVRSDPTLFLLVPGHEVPDVEDVVATASAYNVVRKHAGGPAELAAETDPRA
jgi:hypothetical protein